MVFFTCNACGESLKKAQVDKHLSICRNCQCLSCIDCGKDFWGEDYKNHLKCITEDQKYGGKGFEAKSNKGDVKQQQWIQKIQEVMKKPSISPNIRNILSQISGYDNIPRKKAKFQNWMKNSLKIYNQTLQDQVWEIFSEATSTGAGNQDKQKQMDNTTSSEAPSGPPEQVEENDKKKNKRERKEERQKKNKKEKKVQVAEDGMENGKKKKGKKRKMEDQEIDGDGQPEANGDPPKGKKKKRGTECAEESVEQNSHDEEDNHKKSSQNQQDQASAEENDENNESARGKFNWKGTIKALLKQAPDNELPIKRLRKKVLAQYYTISSTQHKSEEDLLATFNKKIRGNPKFRVLKENVKLLK
ncbi:cell growth-regulating nucleolar protein isoform 2-T2 [Pelodytes ibericus]